MDASHTPTTFFTAFDTALVFLGWRPSSKIQYAMICAFLVFSAGLFRALLAYKSRWERRWQQQRQDDDSYNFAPIPLIRFNKRSKKLPISALEPIDGDNQLQEVGEAVQSRFRWRLSVDVPRALLVTLISVLGYLLMLAVMSLNIGYFCSVIGGIFGGELVAGRYSFPIQYHQR